MMWKSAIFPESLPTNYDPRNKTLSLSDSVYGSTSVAAVGVAAHECGHAIQHQKNYAPLTIRGAIVPVANIGSTLAWPLILIGLFISSRSGQALITAGIICFSLAVLFQIVTLPVEFNASRRAVRILGETGTGLYEKSFRSCSVNLCSGSSFSDSSVTASDFIIWRTTG